MGVFSVALNGVNGPILRVIDFDFEVMILVGRELVDLSLLIDSVGELLFNETFLQSEQSFYCYLIGTCSFDGSVRTWPQESQVIHSLW